MKVTAQSVFLDSGSAAGVRFSRCGAALIRGAALFLGSFCLLNLLGCWCRPGFDANQWWIDLRFLPAVPAGGLMLLSGLGLLAFGLHPPRSSLLRLAIAGGAGALAIFATVNGAQFYLLLARGAIHSKVPIPLSTLIAVALIFVLRAALRPPTAGRAARETKWAVAVCVCCAVLFPLLQMFCFGKTDYRRKADLVVVPGARVYADGRPSDALADRVRTACQLYRQGLVGKLLFSGGPGDGAVHETEGMRRMAIRLGVDPADIMLDTSGLNTQATVLNTEAIFRQVRPSRVLVVSHFYHLPRIKLAYQREGREVYTVPAKESYLLRQLPYNIAREVPALWVYYIRPLLPGAA